MDEVLTGFFFTPTQDMLFRAEFLFTRVLALFFVLGYLYETAIT